MTNEHRFSIGELAKLINEALPDSPRITVRTIRYYVSEGLLPSPVKKGSYGYYGQSHLNRLKLISMWRDERKTLAEINDFMETMPEEEQKKTLKTIRERKPQIQNLNPSRRRGTAQSAPGMGVSARSSSISNSWVDPVSSVGIPSPGEDEVLDQLPASVAPSVPRSVGDDYWIRKELVEGVELHYKAGASEEMRIAINKIVASGRSALSEQRNREKSPGSKRRSRFFHRK